MDFEVPAERRMLVETITRYLGDRYPSPTRSDRDWSAEHMRQFAELGVIGALFGEDQGGFGGSGDDIAAVFESCGKALVVEPLLGMLMAGRVLAACDGGDLLARMIAGEAIALFAHEEADGVLACRAERRGDGWALSGAKSVVPQLAAADEIVVSAVAPGGLSLFLVDAKAGGVDMRGYRLVDGGRGGDLSLAAAPAALIGQEGGGAALIDDAVAAGLLALSAEAVGIMDGLRDGTLDYLRTRHQFGVPIGSFQALKHRMASLALEIEQARSAVTNAAAALDGPPLSRDLAASAAKFTIGKVGTLAADEAIQLHGGIGMTWELPLSHLAKRLIMIGHQLGDEDQHLERYIALRRPS